MSEGLFPIRAVARLTGISADNLRKWESRYNAVSPARTKGGRLFSEDDLDRLKLLKRAVDNGYSIGVIASLPNEDLAALQIKTDLALETRDGVDPHSREIDSVIRLISNYEALDAARMLGKLASFLPPSEFIHTIVMPLMGRIGEEWEAGRMSIAQEHLASTMVRDVLSNLVRLYHLQRSKTRLLFATPELEHHELGILAAAVLAAKGGLGIIYLGVNMPLKDLLKAVEKTKPRAVVLGMINRPGQINSNKLYLRSLRQDLPENIDLIAGGHFTKSMEREMSNLAIPIYSGLQGFESKVQQYGAKY